MSFDLRTHIRDTKTGAVIRKQTYKLHVSRDATVFERGGRFFTADGTEVDKRGRAVVMSETPQEFVREATNDEALAKLEAEVQLKAELEATRKQLEELKQQAEAEQGAAVHAEAMGEEIEKLRKELDRAKRENAELEKLAMGEEK